MGIHGGPPPYGRRPGSMGGIRIGSGRRVEDVYLIGDAELEEAEALAAEARAALAPDTADVSAQADVATEADNQTVQARVQPGTARHLGAIAEE